ncbi:rhomboid family intramembrane serine protease [Flagellimonas algicola]|uniref:Rhomboid family intramembrane serine protease n=1 Tax=Flagellimonas algicola TaxID=2583815 RepID=A0ABY2WQ26_9FLAO|nr:rhomboid family intramembrane serine protease [Allomuricauda algicola]TMU57092.1 rhomboid family intramembrane serine protease [Allomuricauda algicola]
MLRLTGTIKHIIIINFLVWIATLSFGSYGEPFNSLFALHFPFSKDFEFWQLLTHMFMHASYVPDGLNGFKIYFPHILGNMFMLWMFGSAVEQSLGKRRFLFFYLSAGLGAAIITLGFDFFKYFSILSNLTVDLDLNVIKQILSIDASNGNGYIVSDIFLEKLRPIVEANGIQLTGQDFRTLFELNASGLGFKSMLGASGAMTGVLVAFGMMFPESRLMLIFLPVPIKAKYFIPAIIGLDLFSAITGVSIFSPSNTAYIAHLGGAFCGFIMMWYWKKNQFNQNRWN